MIKNFKYIVTQQDVEDQLHLTGIMKKHFDFSSRLRTKIKKNNGLLLNGKNSVSWTIPNVGDEITIVLPKEKSNFIPEDIPIEVVFEDDYLLIINKQAGVVVHPTKGHPVHTIANGITRYMLDKKDPFKIRFINRLDMDTSGLLAIAKNSFCQDHFVRQMGENKVSKRYVALVKGNFEEESGTIDLPIGKDPNDTVKRAVLEDGARCITHFKVLQRFDKGYTLLKLQLETGRTHQIRVHLSYLGHPIVGDYLYGGECLSLIKRQALHAIELDFYHPVTKEKLELKANLPEDFKMLLEKVK